MGVTPPKPASSNRANRFSRHPRFDFCAILFLVCAAGACVAGIAPSTAIVLAFVVASGLFLVLIGVMFSRSRDTQAIRTRARQEDQGRAGRLWVSTGVSVVVLVALVLELRAGHGAGVAGLILPGLALTLAWAFMNTMFALHYAHRYYGDNAKQQPLGGLVFPGGQDPDYWDFLYFSVVIGMTFQVSDVQITSRRLRRVALIQGLVAFIFNMVILALSVNVIAGKI
jgi:uncharacterized membrane protein